MEVGVSRLFFSVEMFILRRYNRRRESEVVEVAILQIDFNKIEAMTFPGMNDGTGMMSARMYNDDSYRIVPTAIHPGGSIGSVK